MLKHDQSRLFIAYVIITHINWFLLDFVNFCTCLQYDCEYDVFFSVRLAFSMTPNQKTRILL